jgi:hypothetical protein
MTQAAAARQPQGARTVRSKSPQEPDPIAAVTGAVRWLGEKLAIRYAGPFMAVVLSVAVIFVGLFYVRTRMQLVQIGYEISGLETKNRDLRKRVGELELEIASLQSPSELEKKAAKIGLVFPPMGRVLNVP